MLKKCIGVFLVLLASVAFAAPQFPSASESIHVHGTLVIKTNQYETMFVFRSGEGNGPADHVMHVWAKPALQIDGGYTGADIDYLGSSLIVTLPSHQAVYTITVEGNTPPVAVVPGGFTRSSFAVVGLSHSIGERAAKQQIKTNGGPAPMLNCETNCEEAGWELPDPWNYGAGAGGCNSGGPNATSCSTSNSLGSCSVTCSGRTYACCTSSSFSPPKCGCIAG